MCTETHLLEDAKPWEGDDHTNHTLSVLHEAQQRSLGGTLSLALKHGLCEREVMNNGDKSQHDINKEGVS